MTITLKIWNNKNGFLTDVLDFPTQNGGLNFKLILTGTWAQKVWIKLIY